MERKGEMWPIFFLSMPRVSTLSSPSHETSLFRRRGEPPQGEKRVGGDHYHILLIRRNRINVAGIARGSLLDAEGESREWGGGLENGKSHNRTTCGLFLSGNKCSLRIHLCRVTVKRLLV